MSENKQAVIFIRARHVGPDEQAATEMQIAAQREACQQAADKLNARIVREYTERGGTDRVGRRPVVQRMLAELGQARDAAYVITAIGDRLARRGVDFVAIDEALTAAGAEVLFARDVLAASFNPDENQWRRVSRNAFAILADRR